MTQERAPQREQPLVDDGSAPTPWSVAVDRLAHPEKDRTNWLATVRPDGRPHLMPVIAFWMDGAFHFVAGEETRKGTQPRGRQSVRHRDREHEAAVA